MPDESKVISLGAEQQRLLDEYPAADPELPEDGAIDDCEYIEGRSVGKYKIIKSIGSGSSSKVVLAYNTETDERVAIKIVQRKKEHTQGDNSDKRIYREIIISTLLNHPNIVRLLDFFYTSSHFFLIFEYVKGMQLYDMVLKNLVIPEAAARRYFRQIISAVDYVHRNCIVHRDLKIENILIDHNDNIKIIDFGLSNFYDNKVLLSTFCGSLYFAAPELLLGQRYHGPEVDIWSLGVVLYVMLCGKVPFDDESVYVLQGKIKNARFEFCGAISAEARDLILNMLLAQPAGRFSLEDVKKSRWANVGYENVVCNYMIARQPIQELNADCVKVLSAALSFQFGNVEDELRNFAERCAEKFGSLDKIYWTRRPIVSLYYLLLEDCCLRSSSAGSASPPAPSTQQIPAILYNFVQFVLSGEQNDLYTRYFTKSVFKHSPMNAAATAREPAIIWPCVKRSYLKGFFKGIKVRHIGTHNALKKMMLDIFKKNDIIYEANERSYFCSFFDADDECYFKVSMYYNVILGEYYLVLTCLNSKKKCFREIYEIIQNAFKERTEKASMPSSSVVAKE